MTNYTKARLSLKLHRINIKSPAHLVTNYTKARLSLKLVIYDESSTSIYVTNYTKARLSLKPLSNMVTYLEDCGDKLY